MKLSISLDDSLVGRIDDYAAKNFMSRSGFFAMASTQLLAAAELSKSISDMSSAMKKIADAGVIDIDDEQRTVLEKFDTVSKLITDKK